MEKEYEASVNNEVSATVISHSSRRTRFLTILPLIGFCCCFYIGVIGCATLFPQYILARLRKNEENITITINNCNINKSDPLYLKEKELQQEASEITSAAAFCVGVPGTISVLILSSLSDHVGRKKVVAITYVGGCIFTVSIALLAAFELPFWTHYIASFLNGASGSVSMMLAAIFASAADVYPRELRSTSIAMIEGSLGVAVVLSNLLVGLWAKKTGFVQPLICLSAFTVSTGVFFIIIRETWQQSNSELQQSGLLGTLTRQLKHMKNTLCRNQRKKKQIIILVIAFSLCQICWLGLDASLILYQLGEPFCWSSDIIGYYTAIKISVMMIGVAVGVAVLRRRISDLELSLISTISFSAYYTLVGLAVFFTSSLHNVMMIVAIPVGSLSLIQFATLRGLSSSLLSKHEQGALFGFIAIGENFSFNFSRVIMSAIYAATVTISGSIIFFLGAGIIAVAFLLLIVYKVFFSQRMEYTDMDESNALEENS